MFIHVSTRGAPLNRLKQQIRSEVPVGTTREQVEHWAQKQWGQAPHITMEPLPVRGTLHTLPESAGVPADQRKFVLDVLITHCGWYTVRGEVHENQLWAFFPLNEQGEVTGQYFLTLEDLAAMGR